MSFCPVAEIGFTVTSERDPGRFEHVNTYVFHVPYALIRLVHVDATHYTVRRVRARNTLSAGQQNDNGFEVLSPRCSERLRNGLGMVSIKKW